MYFWNRILRGVPVPAITWLTSLPIAPYMFYLNYICCCYFSFSNTMQHNTLQHYTTIKQKSTKQKHYKTAQHYRSQSNSSIWHSELPWIITFITDHHPTIYFRQFYTESLTLATNNSWETVGYLAWAQSSICDKA